MDIVGYSKRPMSQQHKVVNQLQNVVRDSPTVKRAREAQQVIILFTGDGMALGFFGEPLVSLDSAREVARAVQSQHNFELRMGLHTGPVYRIEDINANKNIAGGGINIAQRVMDCGDAGHILLSKTYTDYLLQLGEWTHNLRDLGECGVKHGLKLHLFNFYDGEVGNPETPGKLLRDDTAPSRFSIKWKVLIAAAAALLTLIGGICIWWFFFSQKAGQGVTNNNSTVVEEPALKRELNYFLVTQTYRGDKSVGKPVTLYHDIEGAIYFREDDRIRFHFISPQSGYIYLLNEGPQPDRDGRPIYHVMFPSTKDNDASALLEANQFKVIPREEDPAIGFFGSTGAEKVWIIWSATPVAQLEEVKRLNNPKDGGHIDDTGQVDSLQRLLTDNSLLKPTVGRDEPNKRTKLTVTGNLLIYLVRLEHR